jgi:hypothetical protein
VGYADADRDGILQYDEIVLGDTTVYRGSSDPRYQATFNTNLTFLNGRFSLAASFDYQHALTQYNTNARGALMSAANAEGATLLDQAIAQVSYTYPGTVYYYIQTVNTLRFQSLSLGYTLPQSVTTALRMRHGTVSLQGSNLGLRTGYRGIDPNVNSYSSGNLSADRGELPAPREWLLRFNLSR